MKKQVTRGVSRRSGGDFCAADFCVCGRDERSGSDKSAGTQPRPTICNI